MGILDIFRRKPAAPAESSDAWLARAFEVAALHAQTQASRAFDAAQTMPWTESWTGATQDINADIATGLVRARARSRDLARNYDYARGYLIRLKDNVLGSQGVQLQMRLEKRSGGANKETNARIERAWRQFCRRGVCDVSRRFTWKQIEEVTLETGARDGEYLIRTLIGRGPHRFQLQILKPSTLDVELHRDYDGRRVRMGVEIDDVGGPVAYWLLANTKPGDYEPHGLTSIGRHVRVPAEQIIHGFMPEEADQLRGYPWLTVAANRLHMLRDYETAAAVASSNAAKRLGFFVSPDGAPPPGIADTIISKVLADAKAAGKTLSAAEVQALSDAAAKFSTTVPGQFDTLPSGYDFRQYMSQYPHVNYGEYTKECKRGFASGVGASYVTTGNDLESVNYSSARIGILDEREHYKSIQEWLTAGLHAQVFAAWLPMAMLSVPDLAVLSPSRLAEYLDAATWQPRRWEGIDPLKEENANDMRLKNRLTSRRRIILARGEDPDEIDAEIADDPHHPTGTADGTTAPADDNADGTEAGDGAAPTPTRRLRAVRDFQD